VLIRISATFDPNRSLTAISIVPTKPFAFVLMPFEEAFRDIYLLGIKPACEEAGYYCERLDEQIFEETMLEHIYNQIAKADLVVADLTARNPNVFYETGYAHALGQRVILLTRDSEDIPFDLKHHFHIVYSDSITDLKQRLRQRASYYLSNPAASTRNPFDQMSILLNGELLNWHSDIVRVTASVSPPTGYDRESAIRIDAAFHLLDSALDSELEVDVSTNYRRKVRAVRLAVPRRWKPGLLDHHNARPSGYA